MKNQRKPIYKIGTESRDIEPFLRFILDLARELKKEIPPPWKAQYLTLIIHQNYQLNYSTCQ